MPVSKVPPSRRPSSKNASSVCTSPDVTGRRYASLAARDRIAVAHVTSDGLAGWHVKIARRLAVSFAGPVTVNGPPICTEPMLAFSM